MAPGHGNQDWRCWARAPGCQLRQT